MSASKLHLTLPTAATTTTTTATTTTATFARPHHRRTPSASSRTLSPSPTTRPYSALTAGLAASRGAGGVGGMPSPRTSPAMRPTSPLSPGAYKPSPAAGQYFDLLQPPQRPPHSRSNSNHQLSPHVQPQPHQQPHHQQQQQNRHNRSLRLPSFSLPRFHPSRFPSATSSVQSTPDGNSHSSSPQPPMSPRAYQRMYNDAQKQLYFNQHQLFVVATATAAAATSGGRPTSPRLAPLGSPGPVTPLELERDEGYLVAGARNVTHSTTTSTATAAAAAVAATTPSDLADKMVQAEVARQTTG